MRVRLVEGPPGPTSASSRRRQRAPPLAGPDHRRLRPAYRRQGPCRGPAAYPRAPPPAIRAAGSASARLGVRAMDVFTTVCQSQRSHLRRSGVGKSVLLSCWPSASWDVVGRPDRRTGRRSGSSSRDLGEEGLRAIVVVANPTVALKRRRRLYDHGDQRISARSGLEVLCLMDSSPVSPWPSARSASPRRAADHQRLHPDRLHRTAQAAGARRAGSCAAGRHHGGADHRHVHRAGGWGRP
jgi:hypothetical protein